MTDPKPLEDTVPSGWHARRGSWRFYGERQLPDRIIVVCSARLDPVRKLQEDTGTWTDAFELDWTVEVYIHGKNAHGKFRVEANYEGSIADADFNRIKADFERYSSAQTERALAEVRAAVAASS
jgi:hypothetical protein